MPETTPPIVEPLSGAPAPAAPEAPEAPAEDTAAPENASGMSPELLKLPVMQALFAGSPAAVSATISDFEKRPEAQEMLKHKDQLMKAGFGLYRSLDGAKGVVFNQLHIHPEEIKQADTAGKLEEVAPPFDSVAKAVGESGQNNPVLQDRQVPQGMKGPPMPAPVSPVPPASAGVQRKAMAARMANSQPQAPSAGAQPGAGQLLNSILKPVL